MQLLKSLVLIFAADFTMWWGLKGAENVTADWIIHIDPDELLRPGEWGCDAEGEHSEGGMLRCLGAACEGAWSPPTHVLRTNVGSRNKHGWVSNNISRWATRLTPSFTHLMARAHRWKDHGQ
jgi:hypothetical protein